MVSAEVVEVACDPPPITTALLLRLPALVTQVAQAIVPPLVMVPPVIGLVVAMLDTVAAEATTWPSNSRTVCTELAAPVAIAKPMTCPEVGSEVRDPGRDQVPPPGADRARVIPALRHDEREGGPLDECAHLVDDAHERVV